MSRIQVEPAVMRWARESIGLDVAEAAKRIGVSAGVLEAWEEGTRSPTTRQFRDAARVYRRPTFVLMLAEPPTDFQPMRDFRRAGSPEMPYWLRAGIRQALEQLDFYHEIAEHVPPVTAGLPMVTTSTGVENAAQQIRDALGVTIDTQRDWSTPEEALASWREAAVRLGILTVQFERVPVTTARGFSSRGETYSVVGLNGTDSPRGKIFNLLHEIAHLALGGDGVCDLHHDTQFEVERFCNRVAGAALLPAGEVDLSFRALRPLRGGALLDKLWEIGKRFEVSSEATLIRAIELGYLPAGTWDDVAGELHDRYEEHAGKRAKGGHFYRTHIARYGRTYVESALEAHSARVLTLSELCGALDLKVEQVPRLIGAL